VAAGAWAAPSGHGTAGRGGGTGPLGFTNRTDIVTLTDGSQVVVQRYRRREDAEYRLRVMRELRQPAAGAK
jgi:hypothetical protein